MGPPGPPHPWSDCINLLVPCSCHVRCPNMVRLRRSPGALAFLRLPARRQASSLGDVGPRCSPGAAASEREARVRRSRRHSCPRSAWRRGDAQCPPTCGAVSGPCAPGSPSPLKRRPASRGRKLRLRAGEPGTWGPLGCGRALRRRSCRPSRGGPRRWPRSLSAPSA